MTDKQFNIIRHIILKRFGTRRELPIGDSMVLDFQVKDVILQRGCVVYVSTQAYHQPYFARWNFLINNHLEQKIKVWFGESLYVRIRIAPSHIILTEQYGT